MKHYLLPAIRFYNIHIKTFLKTRLTLTVYEGKDRSGRFPLAVAYVGGRKQNPEYWAGLLFSPGFTKHALGRTWIWQVSSMLDRSGYSCGMILFETTVLTARLIGEKGDFHMTPWMRMAIDLTDPVESWRKKGDSAEDVLRRIRKNGLTYMTSRDPALFDEFYHHMYLPYISARHKQEAFTADYFTIKDLFLKGFLLLIKHGQEIIAGVIVLPEKEKGTLKVLGVKDGREDYMRLGVIGAIYYFSAMELQKRGYKLLDIGKTRPVFTNGVTKYKIDMRAGWVPEASFFRECLLIKLVRNTPGLRNFLTHHPFLYYKGPQQPYRALFVENGQFEKKEDFDKFFSSYNCSGLKGTSVFAFGGTDKIKDWVDSMNCKDVPIEPAESLFPGESIREPQMVHREMERSESML